MLRLWLIAIGFILFIIITPSLISPFCIPTCGLVPKAFMWFIALIFVYLFFLNLYLYVGKEMLNVEITGSDIKKFTIYFAVVAILLTLFLYLTYCLDGCTVQVIYLR